MPAAVFCEYIAAIQGLTPAERDTLIDLLLFSRTPFWVLSNIAGRSLTARQAADRALAMSALAKLTRQWSAYHNAAASVRRPVLVAAE